MFSGNFKNFAREKSSSAELIFLIVSFKCITCFQASKQTLRCQYTWLDLNQKIKYEVFERVNRLKTDKRWQGFENNLELH